MDIHDSIYNAAHNYKGGIPALAVRMKKSPNVLQNKVNPNCDTHHVTVEEAAQIADLTESDEIAKSFAARRNMICVPVVEHDGASDMEILDLVIQMNTTESEFLNEMRKAMADGSVTGKEMTAIRKEAHEHMAAIAELVSRIEGMVR